MTSRRQRRQADEHDSSEARSPRRGRWPRRRMRRRRQADRQAGTISGSRQQDPGLGERRRRSARYRASAVESAAAAVGPVRAVARRQEDRPEDRQHGREQQEVRRAEGHAHARFCARPVAGVCRTSEQADRRRHEQRERDDRPELIDGQREPFERVAGARALQRVDEHAPAHPRERAQKMRSMRYSQSRSRERARSPPTRSMNSSSRRAAPAAALRAAPRSVPARPAGRAR